MLFLSVVVRTATAIAVGILVIAILLIVTEANTSNEIVKWFHDAGSWLAGPFKNLFSIHSHRVEVAVNWGIAAVVYGFVGRLLARLLARAAAGGWSGRRATTV
jgi:surface polysaccharide O-acyltransferase-like enzyme